MVNEDDIDLLQRSSDIHGIPRLNESQHFDGHPRAVWLYDSISPPLQEFPPVKYSTANYYHSTNQEAMLYRLQVLYFQKYNLGFISDASKSTLLTVIIWLALWVDKMNLILCSNCLPQW